MSITAEIHKAFRQRITSITEHYCVFENEKYTPVEGVPYLRAWILPATTRPISVEYDNPIDEYVGLFQVDVCTRENDGVAVSDAICKRIEELFKRGTQLACATVIRQPERASGRNRGGWWVVPISIYYRGLA
jgi:hypothetical protein